MSSLHGVSAAHGLSRPVPAPAGCAPLRMAEDPTSSACAPTRFRGEGCRPAASPSMAETGGPEPQPVARPIRFPGEAGTPVRFGFHERRADDTIATPFDAHPLATEPGTPVRFTLLDGGGRGQASLRVRADPHGRDLPASLRTPGGIRTLTPRQGHRFLRPARLPFRHQRLIYGERSAAELPGARTGAPYFAPGRESNPRPLPLSGYRESDPGPHHGKVMRCHCATSACPLPAVGYTLRFRG